MITTAEASKNMASTSSSNLCEGIPQSILSNLHTGQKHLVARLASYPLDV